MARYNYRGQALCDGCGVPVQDGHVCDPADVVVEEIRTVVARGIAQRVRAEITTREITDILWRAGLGVEQLSR